MTSKIAPIGKNVYLSKQLTNKTVSSSTTLAPEKNNENILQPISESEIASLKEERDKIIITEFIHLIEKSRQLFNSLRELPQYGHKSNQWQSYFGRTFEVYTRLWKFQQQHRQLLEQKHNLKRWQIGEIASKIGQLYYHYYLRTSESNYLNESYSFYQAIQARSYYTKANKEEKPDLMVKKLRYYARFIVVCLLLKKSNQVKDLIKEFSKHIDDYIKLYDPEDQLEWQLVKNEINDFIEADSIINLDKIDTILSSRLNSIEIPEIGPNLINRNLSTESYKHAISTINLKLQEIVIIGNCIDQIKFSELSLDMFRILQAVEREPSHSDDVNDHMFHSGSKFQSNDIDQTKIQRENPHKYLLYKPSFSQFFTYVSAAFKDLPPHGILMIYLSADGLEITNQKSSLDHSYDFGGVKTNSKKETYDENVTSINNETKKKTTSSKETHCIYPGDLYPLLRKPLFLIVDSTNSKAFKDFPNQFGQPFVCLLSPLMLPTIFTDQQNQHGNIFTIFLSNPLLGFCYICKIKDITKDLIVKSQSQIRSIFFEIAKSFYRSKSINQIYLQFCRDDFIRGFIFKYVFCYVSLRLHRGFKGQDYYPSCQPYISNEIIENTQVKKLVLALSTTLNIRDLFLDLNDD